MKKRTNPEPKPERLPYVRAKAGEQDRYFTFRLPSVAGGMKLVEAVQKAQGDLGAMEHAFGALLSACWADDEYALEHTEPLAVYEEVHEAGWSFKQVSALCFGLATAIAKQMPSKEEVEHIADFFDLRVPGAAPPSVSASGTSPTPSPGTA